MKQSIGKYMVFGAAGLMMFTGIFMAPAHLEKVTAGEADETERAGTEEDVFRTVLPTATEHVFDFIMDPQGLIRQTDAAAYGDLVFEEDATLFFRRSEGTCEEDYSSSSDALVIVNQGTADAEVVLTASISPDSLGGITLTDDREFTGDTEASLYLALTDGVHTVPINGEDGASLQTVLEKRTVDAADSEYRFWLTGAVNENGDWSGVRDVVPMVTVTWSVTQGEPADPAPEADALTEPQSIKAEKTTETKRASGEQKTPGDDAEQETGRTLEEGINREENGREEPQEEIQNEEDGKGKEASEGDKTADDMKRPDENELNGKDSKGQEENGAVIDNETQEKNDDSGAAEGQNRDKVPGNTGCLEESELPVVEQGTESPETLEDNKSIESSRLQEGSKSAKINEQQEDSKSKENNKLPEDGEGTENNRR